MTTQISIVWSGSLDNSCFSGETYEDAGLNF